MATKKKALSRKPKFRNATISTKAIFNIASKELPAHFRRPMTMLLYRALPDKSKIFFLTEALSKMNKSSRNRLVKKFCPKKK